MNKYSVYPIVDTMLQQITKYKHSVHNPSVPIALEPNAEATTNL